jgi:hypothetical protein
MTFRLAPACEREREGTVPAFSTFATGINESGKIEGDYTDSTGTDGFLAVPEPRTLPLLAGYWIGLAVALDGDQRLCCGSMVDLFAAPVSKRTNLKHGIWRPET